MHLRTGRHGVMEIANKGIFMSEVSSVQFQLANTDESGIVIIFLWLTKQPSFLFVCLFFFVCLFCFNTRVTMTVVVIQAKSLKFFFFFIYFSFSIFIVIQKIA